MQAQEGLEELPRATPRSGGAAERRCPASEVRGRDERSYPTPLSPRPRAAAGRSSRTTKDGAVAGRTNPTSKEPWLHGPGRA